MIRRRLGFGPKLYGGALDVTHLAMVLAESPTRLFTEVTERLLRQAQATDEALAARRGRFRFWRPRGLNLSTYKLYITDRTEDNVKRFEWTAESR